MHFSRSTTSTLSAGSTGSQARLIQSSHQPENYHPIQVEELGKQHHSTKTVKVEIHTVKTKSPNRSPKKLTEHSPNSSRKNSPNSKRTSPKSTSPKRDHGSRSPKKMKSSLKQSSRSLSIENPTCVECYLSGKGDSKG